MLLLEVLNCNGITRHETTEPGAGRDGEDHAARQLFVRVNCQKDETILEP